MKKLWGIFDKRPMIWLHYVLLTLVAYGAYYFQKEYLFLIGYNQIYMLIFWFAVLSIGDQLIHKIIGVD